MSGMLVTSTEILAETADGFLEIFRANLLKGQRCKIITGGNFNFFGKTPVKEDAISLAFMQVGAELEGVQVLSGTVVMTFSECDALIDSGQPLRPTRLAMVFNDNGRFVEAAEVNGRWRRCIPN